MTLTEILKAEFPKDVLQQHANFGDETVVISRDALVQVMRFLKEDSRTDFNFLMDLTAVDKLALEESPRFEVVYHLYSSTQNHRLRVKVGVGEKDLEVDSLVGVWPISNWFEREVWDMFGIRFRGHPDLRRILMYDEFQGHPLRKDYPVAKRQPLIGPVN